MKYCAVLLLLLFALYYYRYFFYPSITRLWFAEDPLDETMKYNTSQKQADFKEFSYLQCFVIFATFTMSD